MASLLDLYEARIVCQHNDQTSINVRHYWVTGSAGSGATDAEFAAALDAAITPEVLNVMSSSAQYRGVGVRRIQPLPVTAEVPNTTGAAFGTLTGDILPTQCCGLLTLRTAFAGPRYRGRYYTPFPPETDSDVLGRPDTSFVGALVQLGTALMQAISAGTGGNTNTFTPVVYSRRYDLKTVITATVARVYWATQRRRGDFGPTNVPPF